MPWYFYIAWTSTSLSAINKLDMSELEDGQLMDCRPVAKGNTLRKIVTSARLKPFKMSIISATKPTQFGSGEKAGGGQLVFGSQTMLEANKTHVGISIDIKIHLMK